MCVFHRAAATRCSKRRRRRRNLSAHFFLSFFLSLDGDVYHWWTAFLFPQLLLAHRLYAENLSLNDLSKGVISFLSTVFYSSSLISIISHLYAVCGCTIPLCWLSCDGLRVYFPSRFGNGGPGLLSTADWLYIRRREQFSKRWAEAEAAQVSVPSDPRESIKNVMDRTPFLSPSFLLLPFQSSSQARASSLSLTPGPIERYDYTRSCRERERIYFSFFLLLFTIELKVVEILFLGKTLGEHSL